jgi:uncharacterized protein (DUF1778 family)
MKADTLDSNVHVRMRSQNLAIIDRAADMLGMNRSQFMIKASMEEATNILLDNRLIVVDGKSFQDILDWLDNPKSEQEKAGIKRLKETTLPW